MTRPHPIFVSQIHPPEASRTRNAHAPLHGRAAPAISRSMTETPQLYLITPPSFTLDAFGPQLAGILDTVEIACLRLSLSADASQIARAADSLREIAHARDVPLVIDSHVALVEAHGLDGLHLSDGARSVRKMRDLLGPDPVVGAFCGPSRHDGMVAGEAGADYIAFGPVSDTGLGDGVQAEDDLFAWWSQMIELPVVAEGGLSVERIEALAPVVDFFAIGPEVWHSEAPLQALQDLTAPLR